MAVHLIITVLSLASLAMTDPSSLSPEELDKAYADEIKEFHFHVYFFQDNAGSNKSAEALFDKILQFQKAGFFHPVPYKINQDPIGPHPVGSYEVWCPKEHFSRVYSWFLLNRGPHSVLIHPLTKEEVKDHTERVAWMGPSFRLDVDKLAVMLSEVPKEYPELGLGYSAPSEQ